jgi:hypothetical protein
MPFDCRVQLSDVGAATLWAHGRESIAQPELLNLIGLVREHPLVLEQCESSLLALWIEAF